MAAYSSTSIGLFGFKNVGIASFSTFFAASTFFFAALFSALPCAFSRASSAAS